MMKKRNLSSVLVIAIFFMSNLLQAQEQPGPTYKVVQPVQLSGPRIGVTFLSDKYVDKIRSKYDIELEPLVAQFGWQFETRFFTLKNGATAVSEWVILIGGFEQEKFIPSLSWLIGFRTAGGFEFGGGPNLALSGTSMVIAVGVTIQSEEINFPINLALATSKSGPRFSLLFGFNMR
ncbi:hypothetical protein KA005_11480 [bacterium]|nr:hypothetical protein [bacterium]